MIRFNSHAVGDLYAELAEEADLEASDWAVLADFATSPGGSDEMIRVYLARGLRAAPEVHAPSGISREMQPSAKGLQAIASPYLGPDANDGGRSPHRRRTPD